MTDSNRSHITLVIDRSGSMDSIRNDAEGAINAFITDQQQQPNPCTLLLADFDSEKSFNIVFDGDLANAPRYRLAPRGGTPLFDAMGYAIVETGERLARLDEGERPGHVFVVIQTDGQENQSVEWKLGDLTDAIKRQETDYGWTFIFLGAGLDAAAQSQAFVGTQMVTNTVRGAGTGASYAGTTSFASTNIASARGGAKDVSYGGDVDEQGNVIPSS